ncbi:MAG TPA: hypothetical protein ENK85_04255 [Saprospiraceae bacterium]|nr:hypothetical protein [Saprospiraceae bacterium]
MTNRYRQASYPTKRAQLPKNKQDTGLLIDYSQ